MGNGTLSPLKRAYWRLSSGRRGQRRARRRPRSLSRSLGSAAAFREGRRIRTRSASAATRCVDAIAYVPSNRWNVETLNSNDAHIAGTSVPAAGGFLKTSIVSNRGSSEYLRARRSVWIHSNGCCSRLHGEGIWSAQYLLKFRFPRPYKAVAAGCSGRTEEPLS
jgi:hypothetical protein